MYHLKPVNEEDMNDLCDFLHELFYKTKIRFILLFADIK